MFSFLVIFFCPRREIMAICLLFIHFGSFLSIICCIFKSPQELLFKRNERIRVNGNKVRDFYTPDMVGRNSFNESRGLPVCCRMDR